MADPVASEPDSNVPRESGGPEPAVARGATDPDASRWARWTRFPARAEVLTIIGITIVGIAIAYGVTRPIEPPAASASTGLGTSFYRIGAETQGVAIGQRAPDFTGQQDGRDVQLTDLDGRPISLSSLAGHPLWVNFWATWCPPCQSETPDLEAVAQAHAADGLVLLAIDVQEPAGVVRAYVTQYGLTYQIGLDTTAAIMQRYGVFGLPTHYFIDRQGLIRDRFFGPLSRAEMERRVAAIEAP